ncbi:MAG TPA: PEP-CTERM sorting domain-containing protein, partial [Tepidisphaeraceae bacterium]|nr:PEP-CTERM sorting domain-containing protein [Tepidisphaeraceae bacterium]
GQWTLNVVKTLPNGWKSVRFDLDNVLDASVPGAGSSAFIEKKIGGVTITINVPEPTSIGAALLGMGALVIRRRK